MVSMNCLVATRIPCGSELACCGRVNLRRTVTEKSLLSTGRSKRGVIFLTGFCEAFDSDEARTVMSQ